MQDLGNWADFVSVGLLCRWAVLFFAICTGFYLALAVGNTDKWTPIFRSFCKILKMYVGWSLFFLVIHLVDWYRTDTICREYIMGWFMSLLVSEPYFHLWYLSALLYALPLFAILLFGIPKRYFIIIALLLWAIQAISYAYVSYLPEAVRGLLFSDTIFEAIHTGWTRLLPLLMIGAWLSQFELRKVGSHKFLVLFLFFFILMVAEIIFVKSLGGTRWSFIFITLPMSATLFCFIITMGGGKNDKQLYICTGQYGHLLLTSCGVVAIKRTHA